MKIIGFWAGVVLPLWDIPLILHILKRKSSKDISVMWAVGLWGTSVMMAPSAFLAKDLLAMGFNAVNVIMLTAVVIVVIKYRKGTA